MSKMSERCFHGYNTLKEEVPAKSRCVSRRRVATMVHQTGFGLGRYQTGPNSKFEFELKKLKIPKKFLKIFQGATNLIVSNFLKKFVHLV